MTWQKKILPGFCHILRNNRIIPEHVEYTIFITPLLINNNLPLQVTLDVGEYFNGKLSEGGAPPRFIPYLLNNSPNEHII